MRWCIPDLWWGVREEGTLDRGKEGSCRSRKRVIKGKGPYLLPSILPILLHHHPLRPLFWSICTLSSLSTRTHSSVDPTIHPSILLPFSPPSFHPTILINFDCVAFRLFTFCLHCGHQILSPTDSIDGALWYILRLLLLLVLPSLSLPSQAR